jgi:tRNA threonylcarbamoyladenosine biosynthesis protein TsaB
MYSLFLDTTSGLTVGLLDKSFRWLSFEVSDSARPSEIVHEKIFDLLKKFNVHLDDLRLITIAGPGSYTGMRLGEGIAEIMRWNKIAIFSFYHFEVPKYVGVTSGNWVANAFKNQVFSYRWNGDDSCKALLAECNDFDAFTLDKTKELIHLFPSEIFSKVIALNEKKETYYFRTLEEEFG